MDERFREAFESVLAHDLDRSMLVELLEADREVRYEELRRSVGKPLSQAYQRALDRLMDHALVQRRLEQRGERYQTHLSLTSRGKQVAEVLEGLGNRGSLPRDLPESLRADIQQAFLGGAQA
jgi:DNA-binding HxlR family transcriptional regulator